MLNLKQRWIKMKHKMHIKLVKNIRGEGKLGHKSEFKRLIKRIYHKIRWGFNAIFFSTETSVLTLKHLNNRLLKDYFVLQIF